MRWKTSAFNNVLVAIDEFHHVSADTGNQLGEVLRERMTRARLEARDAQWRTGRQ